MNNLRMRSLAFGVTALCLVMFAQSVAAQTSERKMECDSRSYGDHGSRFCEIREQTLASTGSLAVDGLRNGGVKVRGWERNEVLVRAKVEAWGETDSEARSLAAQVKVETNGNRIQAAGNAEQAEDNSHWAVSYEIFAPRNSDLSLKTYNGGISVADIRGRIEFEAHNGGVSLNRLAGAVKGATTNGGLNVILSGDKWEGEGLDVRTTNGGVRISIPKNYSAHLETATTHGGMHTEIGASEQGRFSKAISMDIGQGGRTIKVITTNGGVSVTQQS